MKKSASAIGLLLAVAQAQAMQKPVEETVHLPKLSVEASQRIDSQATVVAWSDKCTPWGFKPGTRNTRCN
jgi:hypothetical protein